MSGSGTPVGSSGPVADFNAYGSCRPPWGLVLVLEAEWEHWGFSIQASSLEGYKAKRLGLVRLVGYQIKPRKSEQRNRITEFFHAFLVAKIVQKS